jgi:hypothetical protein
VRETHQPSSKEGGLCIGEEIIGAPMCRWKKGCILVCYVLMHRKRELIEVWIDG